MRFVKGGVLAILALVVGIFGFSYVRNPDLSAGQHADAVGFVLANPVSSSNWQGLACAHRRAVIDLVTMSLAPKLCGASSDGGARARAQKFRQQGLDSCWSLYETLLARDEDQYKADMKAQTKSAAAQDYCKRAEALMKKAG